MEKTNLARKLMFLLKACLVVSLASISLNASAHYRHNNHCCYSQCDNCYTYNYRSCYRPVCYKGPDCNGYYTGSDCSRIVWVPCHWDVYGNYIPGYWLSVGR